MSLHRWLQNRECGFPSKIGDRDLIMNRVYGSIRSYKHWNKSKETSEFGAVFNMEFSPEGNVLAAACEKKCILFFDPVTTRQTHVVPDAHLDNVNCIKFLDDRMFATCSDDTTVALWDLRYLKSKLRSLYGHSNWVKNIEYSHKDKLLVTAGFDGSIYSWDINSYTEQGLIYQRVFHTSGLMRCRISPDDSKLVICSTGGYLMIIHKLDLHTLHRDLCGFRPNIYRLMQMGPQYIPQAAKFDRVFSKEQKRNRVELLTDFHEDNDAEVILALQIHPHGRSVLSRNISYDEMTEWSCIHDLNDEYNDVPDDVEISERRCRHIIDYEYRLRSTENNDGDSNTLPTISQESNRLEDSIHSSSLPLEPTSNSSINDNNSNINNSRQTINRPETFIPDIWAAEVTVQERTIRQNRARSSSSVTGYNYVYAINSGVLPTVLNYTQANQQNNISSMHNGSNNNDNTISIFSGTSSRRRSLSNENESYSSVGRVAYTTSISVPSNNNNNTNNSEIINLPPHVLFQRNLSNANTNTYAADGYERRIVQNPKKLMYYIVEPNKGKGFIKEPCFSADGRIVCSPYDKGVRLLAFSDCCSEYPQQHSVIENIKNKPKQLVVVKEMKNHDNIVLSTKFSPREPLLVTGCKSGQIIWYHPQL